MSILQENDWQGIIAEAKNKVERIFENTIKGWQIRGKRNLSIIRIPIIDTYTWSE